MASADPADVLSKLIAQQRKAAGADALVSHPTDTPEGTPPACEQLVFSMLLWDATTSQALTGLRRLREAFADLNELRVAYGSEVVSVIGEKYPRALERAERLSQSLNAVYAATNDLSMEAIANMPKRDARACLEAMPGIPAYVAARWSLLVLGAHAVPLDERLFDLLRSKGAIPEGSDLASAGAWLERTVRASDALETHLTLQNAADTLGKSASRRPAHRTKKTARGA
ncbi:MAG: hypothetical protein RBS39_12010 [Phycisphaerales bacterium]|jgi:hypothetical protein|nr:hypothetical protein [Phycisphaerales bacterium]